MRPPSTSKANFLRYERAVRILRKGNEDKGEQIMQQPRVEVLHLTLSARISASGSGIHVAIAAACQAYTLSQGGVATLSSRAEKYLEK